MRVLVYPHTMEIGGSQLNAVETAGAVRDRGHDVSVVSAAWPAGRDWCASWGYPHPLDPRDHAGPCPTRARGPADALAREQKFDIVHGYEWPPWRGGDPGPRLRLGVPVLCTVMSMAVAPFLPHYDAADRRHRRAAAPRRGGGPRPGDARWSRRWTCAPTRPSYEAGSFRAELGLDPDVPLVAVVCRLVPELKLEGMPGRRATRSGTRRLGYPAATRARRRRGRPRRRVEEAAAAANARAGRRVVDPGRAAGDPRPAYAAADVVFGMGGSALRAMAFAKPLVVRGESASVSCSRPNPRRCSCGRAGAASAPTRVAVARRRAAGEDPRAACWATRAAGPKLGEYGRKLVLERFSLDHAAAMQEQLYGLAAREPPGPAVRPRWHGCAAHRIRRLGTGPALLAAWHRTWTWKTSKALWGREEAASRWIGGSSTVTELGMAPRGRTRSPWLNRHSAR